MREYYKKPSNRLRIELSDEENKPLTKKEINNLFYYTKKLFAENACKELENQVKEWGDLTESMIFD